MENKDALVKKLIHFEDINKRKPNTDDIKDMLGMKDITNALNYVKQYFPQGSFSAKDLSDACGEKIVAAMNDREFEKVKEQIKRTPAISLICFTMFSIDGSYPFLFNFLTILSGVLILVFICSMGLYWCTC